MPKRPRNLVKKSGRPGWYFRRKEGGKTIWRSLGTDYETACSALRKLKSCEAVRSSDLTVKQAAQSWLSSYIATARREEDRPLAEQRVRDYLVPALGHLLVERVSPEELRRYRIRLESGHLSKQSVVHVLSDCRCLFRWCHETGLIDRVPVPRKFLPKIQERPPERLSDEEVEQVTRLEGSLGFAVRILLGTGLRWGEFARLTSGDVVGPVVVVHQTKSGKVRRVPLPPPLQVELKSRIGRLCSYRYADVFNRAVRRLTGIETFHAHQLRHTFATKWIEDGGSLASLQAILGHSTVVTTQRYAKMSDEYVQADAERVWGRREPEGVPRTNEEQNDATG